jgi:hypothetical protein
MANNYFDQTNTDNPHEMQSKYDLLFGKITELSDKYDASNNARSVSSDPTKIQDFLDTKDDVTGQTIADELYELTGFTQGTQEQTQYITKLIEEIANNEDAMHRNVTQQQSSPRAQNTAIKDLLDNFHNSFINGPGNPTPPPPPPIPNVAMDYGNTSSEFSNLTENYFEISGNGKEIKSKVSDNDLALKAGDIADAISEERKLLLNKQKQNQEMLDELDDDDPARAAILESVDKVNSGLALVDAQLEELKKIDKSKLSSDASGKINKATNEKEASDMAAVEKAKKEAMSGFEIITQGSQTFSDSLYKFDDIVGGVTKSLSGMGGTIDAHSGILSENFQNLGKTVLLTGGVFGMFMGAMGLATTAIKGFYDKLDIARDFNQGSGMVDAIRGMELKTLLPPEQLKAMSETLSANFGISMTRNRKDMEKMAIKQRMYERMMGKENAAQMLESLDGLRNSLGGDTADDMMANLAAQTTSLAKTMGISNKFALEQIKRLKENTAVLTEGLDKDAAAAIQKTMEKEYAALAKVVGADAAEALTKAGAEALSSKENIAEDLGKQMTMLDLGGAGAERMEKVFKEAGLNKEQAFELYADAQLHGFENMSKEDQVTLTKLMTGSQVAQAEEIASVRQAMQEAATNGDKAEEQRQKERLALLSNRGLKGNSDVANAVKAGKMGKQYDNAKVEAGERQEGETAKIEINKLLAQATGGGSVEETNKLFNQLISETKLTSEQQKQFTGNFNKFASDDLKAKMKEKGITEKDIEGKSPEELMKLFEAKGLSVKDYQGTIQDAFAGAAGPELAEKIKKMRTEGKGSMKIGDKVVQGAQFKKDDESGKLADKQVASVSTSLEIAQDDATRLVIKANHAMEKSVMGLVNDTLSSLKNALTWVTQNLNILAAAVMALGAAYLTSKLVNVTKKIGSGLTSFVNSMLPAEKKFKGFGDMLGSAMSGMNKVVKSSFSILPGFGKKKTKLDGPPEPDIGFWEKMKKGYGSFKEGLKGGLKGLAGGLKSMVGPQAILAAGMLAFQGAMDGWGKATDIFISKADQDAGKTASIGQKFSAALGGAINALSFGLVDTESAAKGIYSAFSDFGGFLEKTGVSQIFRDVKDGIVGAVTDLKNKVMTIIDFFGPTISAMKDSAIQVFGGFVQYIKGTFNIIKGIFTGDLTSISDGIKNIVNGWVDIVTYPLTLIEGLLRNFFGDKVADVFGGAVETAKAWFKDKIGTIITALTEPFLPFIERMKNIVSNIKTMILEPFKGLFALITGDWEGFKNSFFNIWSAFGSFMKNVPLALWDAVKGIGGVFVGLFDSVWESVLDLGAWFGQIQWSKLFMNLGMMIFDGLVAGFFFLKDDLPKMIGKLMSDMWFGIKKWISSFTGGDTILGMMGVDEAEIKKLNEAVAKDEKQEKKKATTEAITNGAQGEDLQNLLSDMDMSTDNTFGKDQLKNDEETLNVLKALSDAQIKSLLEKDYDHRSQKILNDILKDRASGKETQKTLKIDGKEIEMSKKAKYLENARAKVDIKDVKTVEKDGKKKIADFSEFEGKSREVLSDFIRNFGNTLDEDSLKKLKTMRSNSSYESGMEKKFEADQIAAERGTNTNYLPNGSTNDLGMVKPTTSASKGTQKPPKPNLSMSTEIPTSMNTTPITSSFGADELSSIIGSSTQATTGKLDETNGILAQIRDNTPKKSDQGVITQQLEKLSLSAPDQDGFKTLTDELTGKSVKVSNDDYQKEVSKLTKEIIATGGDKETAGLEAADQIMSKLANQHLSGKEVSKTEKVDIAVKEVKAHEDGGSTGGLGDTFASVVNGLFTSSEKEVAGTVGPNEFVFSSDMIKNFLSKVTGSKGDSTGVSPDIGKLPSGDAASGIKEVKAKDSQKAAIKEQRKIADETVKKQTKEGIDDKQATQMVTSLKDVVINLKEQGKSLAGNIGSKVSNALGVAGKAGAGVAGAVGGVLSGDMSLSEGVDALKNVGKNILGENLTGALKGVTDKLGATGSSIVNNMQGVLSGETSIGDALKNVGGTMKEQLLGPLTTSLQGGLSKLTGPEGLGGVFDSFTGPEGIGGVLTKFTSGEGGIGSIFNSFTGEGGALDSVLDSFDGDGSISETFNTITSPEGPLGSALGGIGDSITGALGSFDFGGMLGGLGDAVGGLFGGGDKGGSGVMDSVSSAAKSVGSFFGFDKGGRTPSQSDPLLERLTGMAGAAGVVHTNELVIPSDVTSQLDKAIQANPATSAGTSGVKSMSGVKSSTTINNTGGNTSTIDRSTTNNTTNNTSSAPGGQLDHGALLKSIDANTRAMAAHLGQRVKQGDREYKANVNGQTVQNVKNMQGSKTLH